MPRLRNRLPSYSLHKASGQAVVWFDGREHYLGKYGSPESHANYRRLTAELAVSRAQEPTARTSPEETRADLRIDELLVAYLDFAERYYVKNGRPTGEFSNMKEPMRPLHKLYGATRVWEFSPTALRTVREGMITANLSRKVINSRINRVRRIFKWGAEREFVDPSVLQKLQAVSPLKRGRSTARETDPVRPVPQKHIDVVLAQVTPQIHAMIEVQKLTGMRPGERRCRLPRGRYRRAEPRPVPGIDRRALFVSQVVPSAGGVASSSTYQSAATHAGVLTTDVAGIHAGHLERTPFSRGALTPPAIRSFNRRA